MGVSGKGKRNDFKLHSLQFSMKIWTHKKLPDSPSEWQEVSYSEIKKNKNVLAKFIPRKFAQFLSASVILDFIQTPMWLSGFFFFFFFFKKKERFQRQVGPHGKRVPEVWQGFYNFFGMM